MVRTVYRHVFFILCCCLVAQSAAAGDSERARELLKNGEILSLSEILSQVSSKIPGKLLEVELEERKGRVVYEIEFLGEDGVVIKMLVEAKTGVILSVEVD